MKICFWKNNKGKCPAQVEVEKGLGKRDIGQLARRIQVVTSRTENILASGTMEKVQGVPERLKLKEVRLSIQRGEVRFMAVLTDGLAYFLSFLLRKETRFL